MAWVRDSKTFGIQSILAVTVCFCAGLCSCQYATFDVLNQKFDDAVFVGEQNIVLRCCVSDSGISGTIRIEPPNGNAVTSNGRTNALDYTISTIQVTDGGDYRCTTDYKSVDGRDISEELLLYLNVPNNDDTPKCARNGTYGQPYTSGDWLLLSCFCRMQDKCQWKGSHSTMATNLTLYRSYEESGTRVLQILLNHGTNSTSFHKFNCIIISGTTATSCSIGPENNSSDDIIVNTVSRASEECTVVTATTTIESFAQYTPTKQRVVEDHTDMATTGAPGHMSTDMLMIIYIAIGIIVSILIILIIILIVVCYRRSVNTHHGDGDDESPGFKNNAYSTDDDGGDFLHYNDKSRPSAITHGIHHNGNNEAVRNTTMSHTYDAPPPRGSETSAVDSSDIPVDDYAEIGESRSQARDEVNDFDSFEGAKVPHRNLTSRYTLVKRTGADIPGKSVDTGDSASALPIYAQVDKTKKRVMQKL